MRDNPCSLPLFFFSRSTNLPLVYSLFHFYSFLACFAFNLHSLSHFIPFIFASISFSLFLPFFASILFPTSLGQQFIRSKLKLKPIRTKIDRVNFTTRHLMLICIDRSVYIRTDNREVDSSIKKKSIQA